MGELNVIRDVLKRDVAQFITESPTLPGNRKYRETTVFFAKRPFPGELPLKFAIFGKMPLKIGPKPKFPGFFHGLSKYMNLTWCLHATYTGNVT